jgi:hypothetical protein
LHTSFTVGTWLLVAGYLPKAILSDCNDWNPICIVFSIADTTLNLRVMLWNNGSILDERVASVKNLICHACWMHASFSFDYQTGSTVIYFNGRPMQETYLNMTYTASTSAYETKASHIGLNAVTRLEPFYGLIDRLSITYYVKNSSEILYEATSLFDFTFNTDDVNADNGPIRIPARSQHAYRSISRNQSTLLLNSTDSYFQTAGFTLLDSNDYSYSLVFWLRLTRSNSTDTNSAIAVLQLSSLIDRVTSGSYSCVISLHVYPNNGTIGYFFPKLFEVVNVQNSFLGNNTWVHIGVMFSDQQTYQFYQNGQLIYTHTNKRFSSIISDYPRFALTVGGAYLNDSSPGKPDNFERMKCFAIIPIFNYTNVPMEIDDLKLYSRELTTLEFADLAASKDQS